MSAQRLSRPGLPTEFIRLDDGVEVRRPARGTIPGALVVGESDATRNHRIKAAYRQRQRDLKAAGG